MRLLPILVSFAAVVSPMLSAEETLPPAKQREFIRRFIEHLPPEQRQVYFSQCQNDEPECPVRSAIGFAETLCTLVSEGRYKTRKQTLDSMGSFLISAEAEALVDTAIEVICPQYQNRLP